LADPSHQTSITAVATVANNTPYPLAFDPAHNAAGDAVRVLDPYAQQAERFNIVAGEIGTVSLYEDGQYGCQKVTVNVRDQLGREIVGANVDVNAAGPGNGLRFDTGLFSPAALQAPDRQAHVLQPGYDCLGANPEIVDDQGSHRVLGAPDIKHIESGPTGTNDSGNWSFALWSPANHVTADRWTARWTAWVDEVDDECSANDDRFTDGELSVSGLVGFGSDPVYVPPFAPMAMQKCIPEPDGQAARELTMASNRPDVLTDTQAVTLFGELVSAIATTQTSATGTFERTVPAKRGRNQYRAVAPAAEKCVRAASKVANVQGH
jgi:hypothetical protein